jgi:hypothetical protein
LLLQSLEDKIDSFEEQRSWRKDLALCRVGEDALVDAILGKVGVEVDFRFVNEFEV